MILKRYEILILRVLNRAARLFGVLACIASLVFLVSAWTSSENRVANLLVAALLLPTGIAILRASPISQSQIDAIRNGVGRRG